MTIKNSTNASKKLKAITHCLDIFFTKDCPLSNATVQLKYQRLLIHGLSEHLTIYRNVNTK